MERRPFLKSIPFLGLSSLGGAAPQKTNFSPDLNHAAQLELLENLARPVWSAWENGKLLQAMDRPGFPRKDRLKFSALEAVARLFYGQIQACPGGAFMDQGWLDALQKSLTETNHPDAFNWDKGEQPLVDAAILAAGFLRQPTAFEKRLTDSHRAGLIEGWRKSLSIKPYDNNWVLFASVVEAALQKWDKPYKPEAIGFGYEKMESWYLGDGWYGDGPRFHADYYNSIIIHPFLQILDDLGHADPEMAEKRKARSRRFGQILYRMLDAEGNFPVLGRSICYRAGLFHHLAFLALSGKLPPDLPGAGVRIRLSGLIRRTLEVSPKAPFRPGSATTDAQTGILRPGLFGFQPGLAESYINTASLYLTTWAFLPLGLGSGHPYWVDPAPATSLLPIDKSLKEDESQFKPTR
jgi:hypothetical protein